MAEIKKIRDFFEKSPVVLFSDIDRIIKSKKKTQYAKQIIIGMMKSGEIKRLTKGCYTSKDDIGLSVLCFKPAYLGLHSALSYHNLWEQETIPIIITSNRIRPGIRKCIGMNIMIRRSDRKYIFGYDYSEDSGYYLPYSDIEKTFIDFFVFREKLSPELITNFQKKIDKKKLQEYLKKYPERICKKVSNALAKQNSIY